MSTTENAMRHLQYFYQCSPEYIDAIDGQLRSQILHAVSALPRRATQLELNHDIAWLLTHYGWGFASLPPSMPQTAPADLGVGRLTKEDLRSQRDRRSCLASQILGHEWVMDFSRTFGQSRVYIEVQFGKKEALLMDLCKLRIAYYERHMSLGIEIVISEPSVYFAHRRASVSGMASFSVAKEILPIIGFDCPIWLIGLMH